MKKQIAEALAAAYLTCRTPTEAVCEELRKLSWRDRQTMGEAIMREKRRRERLWRT